MSEILEIPLTSDDPSFRTRTTLEGVEVVLQFDWNTRNEKWYLSIFDSDENPLIMSLALNIDTEVLSRFAMSAIPPGQLALYDSTGSHVECGRDEIGGRCKLLYKTAV